MIFINNICINCEDITEVYSKCYLSKKNKRKVFHIKIILFGKSLDFEYFRFNEFIRDLIIIINGMKK